MEEKKNFIKHDIKDIIFSEAISSEENIPEIYKALLTESEENLQPSDFEITSLDSVFVNSLINDLSFFVDKKNTMIFVEAQSDWDKEDLKRFSDYIFEVRSDLKRHKTDFKTWEVKTKFFILSTSGKEPKTIEHHLSEVIPDLGPDSDLNVDIKFTVISRKNGNVPEGTIIEEYFRFCEIQKEVFRDFGMDRKAFEKLIQRCLDEGVLVDFIEKNKEKIVKNLGHIYDQERLIEELIERKQKQAKEEQKEQFIKNLRKMGLSEEEIKTATQPSS